MSARRPGHAGFTLMEIVIVLAVIGILIAVLAPLSFRYIDDAHKAQAQHDINIVATAIEYMYKDTGATRWRRRIPRQAIPHWAAPRRLATTSSPA